jgi:ribosome biogenesis GTPase
MKGLVIKSTGSWLTVESDTGKIINCKLKGNFRTKGIKSTNPVAVGDLVTVDIKENQDSGWITEIMPRFNYIVRKATRLSKISHIIASNIDQACLVVTLAYPRTSTGFIDRFLVTTEAYHIPASIVFNKIDLYDGKMIKSLEELERVYRNADYGCLHVSALTGEHLEDFKDMLKDKKTLLSGHSGVGKSALVNIIESGLNLKTRAISNYHNKGLHTTTFAEMFKLTIGGYVIDTPGIKEFGLTDFNRQEIAERFPEMRKYMHQCRFNNCTHTHEPHCAVMKALENGEIYFTRYENYLSILNDDYWEKVENDYRLK